MSQNKKPELPSQKDLAWALIQVMDGTQEHDLVAMTGLPEKECAKVFEIYSQVCKIYYPSPSHWLPQSAIPTRQ